MLESTAALWYPYAVFLCKGDDSVTKLRDKRLFLLDMDGTIYIGDRLFDGVPEFLRHVRAMGGRYLFLTNNSSRGVEGYMEKLRRMGIETTRDDYLTSVDATVRYLRETLPGKTCYVFGTDSFLAQLDGAGIPVTRDREQAEVLLCGFDTELTFQKLEDACILLNRGVPFVATNPDWVCPTWYGSVPDCGSVCRMLTTATGREPTVIGKPRPQMALLAMERTGCSPEQTVLLGDRLYTDVAAASTPASTPCSSCPARAPWRTSTPIRSTPPGCIPTSVPCTGNWRRLYETQLQADYFRGLCLLPDLLVLAGL